MVLLQAESEIAAINMVYGAASTGKKAFTSSSSPGMSLKMEGISYLAGAELPCLIVNVVRGGPGLGSIQPSQADYFQATKGGGHGDYHTIVLAPASVQEMSDFVKLAFDLAFKYRIPVIMLSDGLIGQMMEKVELFDPIPRNDKFDQDWTATGKPADKKKTTVTSLFLDPLMMEQHNKDLQAKYAEIGKNEVRYELLDCDDADYLFISYGSSSRICQKAMQLARKEGIKIGLIRPITLYPFPYDIIASFAPKVKGMLTVELSTGQMIEDVRLAVEGKVKVLHYGRFGGAIHSPEDVLEGFKEKYMR
jgi:2-oxoglutarate/2-oxoacid ferredoxin oxidoreductase subunit alpha